MKITTLFYSLIAVTISANAQNLLVNPSFEGWIDGKPSLWIVSPEAKGFTVSQEKTIVSNGTSSFKIVTDGTIAARFHQILPVTPGKTYTLSLDYYVLAGNETDASINCNFRNGETYLTDTQLTAHGILDKLKAAGGNPLKLQGTKGVWHNYTCEVVAPASTTDFDFEIVTNPNSTVFFDNRYFGEKIKTVLENTAVNNFSVKVIGDNLLQIIAARGSMVEIYDASGAKIQSAILTSNTLKTNNLPKGAYMVRVGKHTQKVIL